MLKVKDKYKSYLQARASIDKYNAFKTILYSDNDTLTETLFNNHISKLKLTKAISICDVGGGDGKRITDLATKIHNQFHCDIHLDFIEQSALMCADFKASSIQLEKFCKIEFHSSEVESTSLNNEYDIIFLIHSIFCFNHFSVFRKIFDKVKSGGVLYVVSNSSDSFLSTLKRKFDLKYDDKRYEIKDLLSDMQLYNIRYETDNFRTEWILNNNEVDEKLSVILDWLSLGEFPSFDVTIQMQLIEFAKNFAYQYKNRYNFSEKEVIFILKKTNFNFII